MLYRTRCEQAYTKEPALGATPYTGLCYELYPDEEFGEFIPFYGYFLDGLPHGIQIKLDRIRNY